MKKLLITTIILSATNVMACNISMQVKKEGAKTAYVNGVSVSAKIREALSSQCKVTYKVMTKEEVRSMQVTALEKRLAKLKADK